MTTEIFSQALGIEFKKTPHKGNRLGCACMESRGLGDYNSCPNGCRYCYANKDHAKALQNYLTHNPDSPLLLGNIQPGDKIVPSRQESLLSKEPRLFD
jgi:DNA repair photolyase